MTTSETGEPGGFTLVEILLVLALIGLIGWIFVGGSAALLADQGSTPDEQFWKACTAARKQALEEEKSVVMGFDAKARAFTLNDGSQEKSIPVTGPDDLLIDFHPLQSDSTSLVLIGGVVVDTTPLPAVTFYDDGTCTPFRAQVRSRGAAHILSVDPWTCAPEIGRSDATP